MPGLLYSVPLTLPQATVDLRLCQRFLDACRQVWLSLLWGTIKDRNGMDLTEAEDIKKRWQQYMEELYKQDLHDPDNYHGVITHLEPQTSWNVKSSGP